MTLKTGWELPFGSQPATTAPWRTARSRHRHLAARVVYGFEERLGL